VQCSRRLNASNLNRVTPRNGLKGCKATRGVGSWNTRAVDLTHGPSWLIDPFEGMKVIEQVSQVGVHDVVPAGDAFKVTVRVLGTTTVHLLKVSRRKMPPARVRLGLGPSVGPTRTGDQHCSGAALYKKLLVSTEGYEGDAPIVHQAVAVKAAIDALDNAFAEDRDANFNR
jgi:hypothetical protein